MNFKQLATLKNAYDRKKELQKFEKDLIKNPLQVSEYIQLISESNLDIKEQVKYRDHIKTLKKNNMIIDDIPEPFEDFTTRVEAEGYVPIKKSVMKQMDKDEFHTLTAKKIKIYDDMNGAESIQHYTYRTKYAIEKTGDGISVVHKDTEDVEVIKNAQRSYKAAKDTIAKTLTEIEVNADKYQDFRGTKE